MNKKNDAAADKPAAAIPAFSLTLTTPIQAHGDDVPVLNFRKPTARDILTIGNPVIFEPASDPPKITHDERKMTAMLSALAGVPPSSILQLEPEDWVSAAWGVSPFFLPRPGTI